MPSMSGTAGIAGTQTAALEEFEQLDLDRWVEMSAPQTLPAGI